MDTGGVEPVVLEPPWTVLNQPGGQVSTACYTWRSSSLPHLVHVLERLVDLKHGHNARSLTWFLDGQNSSAFEPKPGLICVCGGAMLLPLGIQVLNWAESSSMGVYVFCHPV